MRSTSPTSGLRIHGRPDPEIGGAGKARFVKRNPSTSVGWADLSYLFAGKKRSFPREKRGTVGKMERSCVTQAGNDFPSQQRAGA
ncbi:hypothetical protein VN12_03475 [Pirellula sp. SH-Sr6A]|nr:hypothetical protein VN12_03475 [Pirellula sp. SH-Sr6A]